jgi:hypothetical protein
VKVSIGGKPAGDLIAKLKVNTSGWIEFLAGKMTDDAARRQAKEPVFFKRIIPNWRFKIRLLEKCNLSVAHMPLDLLKPLLVSRIRSLSHE